MRIEIKLEELNTLGITPDMYVYLYMKYYNIDLIILSIDFEFTISELEEKGYIKHVDEGVILREKANRLFRIDDLEQKWNVFKSNYPIKSGSRRLHDQQDKCKEKFFKYIKESGVFEQIMKGLNNEMNARINASRFMEFFPDWKAMSAYLNQAHWKTYLDDDILEEEFDGGQSEDI